MLSSDLKLAKCLSHLSLMRYRLFAGMSSSPQASLVVASLFICSIQSVSNKLIVFYILGEVEPILLITHVIFLMYILLSDLWTNKNINK